MVLGKYEFMGPGIWYKEIQISSYSKVMMIYSNKMTFEPHHENTGFLYICENKDADQLRSNREADQRLCFCYTDSTIPLLPKSEISSL